MTVVAALNSASRRALVRQALVQTQKRSMGLGGSKGPPPKWEGIDKTVRSYVPEDYQLSAAILSGYFSLYVVYSLVSMIGGKKKKEEPAPVAAAPTTASGEVPDIESPDFEKFLDSEALVKLLDNEEQLKSVMG